MYLADAPLDGTEDLDDETFLFEGKAVGTSPEVDLVLRTDKTVHANAAPWQFQRERTAGAKDGRTAFRRIQSQTSRALDMLLTAYDTKQMDTRTFTEEMRRTMRRAWREAFLCGVRAGGQPSGRGKVTARIEPADEAWLLGAMKHEMGFLNGFVGDVVTGGGRMPYHKRARMYVDAMRSFYDSGRVIAMPATSLFYWTGPNDKRTCPSCAYMFSYQVFSKKTLPTTPRSGLTLCLTNCRDKLLVRQSTPQKVLEVTERGPTRETHIRLLRKIKRDGNLPTPGKGRP